MAAVFVSFGRTTCWVGLFLTLIVLYPSMYVPKYKKNKKYIPSAGEYALHTLKDIHVFSPRTAN